ncbi:MAG TPA: taurine dioxygenase [Myxococcales bacterium]|nr:taurine dioxygenase [Myxococcales bacterium]
MLDLHPLSPEIGAEVLGLRLSRPLSPQTIQEIRAALVEFGLLIFPEQALTEEEHIDFARAFGTPEVHPTREGAVGRPEIFVIDSAEGAPAAEWWHTDMTALPAPPMGSILHMRIIPEKGGDTEWASQTAAYAALPATVQARLEGLQAEHQAWWDAETRNLHPVVHVHPESGLKSLFVNGIFTQRIVGIPEAESRELLEFLYAHAVEERFVVRHRWRKGDIAFWDNRSTQHRVHNDFGEARRRIHRVTLLGQAPV